MQIPRAEALKNLTYLHYYKPLCVWAAELMKPGFVLSPPSCWFWWIFQGQLWDHYCLWWRFKSPQEAKILLEAQDGWQTRQKGQQWNQWHILFSWKQAGTPLTGHSKFSHFALSNSDSAPLPCPFPLNGVAVRMGPVFTVVCSGCGGQRDLGRINQCGLK